MCAPSRCYITVKHVEGMLPVFVRYGAEKRDRFLNSRKRKVGRYKKSLA
jgi:hypothetical protein